MEVKTDENGNNTMIGAIVGDIVGSRFEWYNRKTKESIRGRHPQRHLHRRRFRYDRRDNWCGGRSILWCA